MDREFIRKRVRHMITVAELPCEEGKTWAGRGGIGDTCMACGESIAPTEIEYEVDLPSSRITLRLHLACHRIWLEECRAEGLLPGN